MTLIFAYLKKHKTVFLITMLLLAIEAACALFQPALMSYIVDNGIAEMSVASVLGYGLLMLALTVLGAIVAILRNITSVSTSQCLGEELRHDIYSHTLHLSEANIDKLDAGSIITRITNDVVQVQEFVNGLMRIIMKAPFMFIGSVVLTIVSTPDEAPFIFAIVIIVSILIFLNMKISYPRFGRVQKMMDGLNTRARDFLTGIRIVKAFTGEEHEKELFRASSTAVGDANVSALSSIAFFSPLISFTINGGIVLLLYLSRNQRAAEIGKLMASVNYMTQMLFSITSISNSLNTATRAQASALRIKEVLDEKDVQIERDGAVTEFRSDIEFSSVSFFYNRAQRPSLENISFRIERGEKIGIIGPTGSGKSTLIKLIPHLYSASSGTIMIGGVPIEDIDEKALRDSISIVFQKAVLFSGTIRDNILWGCSDAGDEELIEAARFSEAYSFIEKMPDGFDSVLGQGGVNLSGGQRQRIAIARAIIHKPDILILDDATSALDAATERRVLDNISALSDDMTVLLISQRISSVASMDRIICMNDGRIEMIGTHSELMKASDTYRSLARSQLGALYEE